MVVHIDWDTLAGLDDHRGTVDLPFAATIAADVARDLAHTARLEVSLDNKWGNPIGIGRSSRTWPSHLFRRIHHRDHGPAAGPAATTRSACKSTTAPQSPPPDHPPHHS